MRTIIPMFIFIIDVFKFANANKRFIKIFFALLKAFIAELLELKSNIFSLRASCIRCRTDGRFRCRTGHFIVLSWGHFNFRVYFELF